LPRDGSVDDDHHRWRDQNAQRAACGDHPGGKLDVIAGAQHRVHRDDAHQHHDCAYEAAGDTPEGADNQRRYGQ